MEDNIDDMNTFFTEGIKILEKCKAAVIGVRSVTAKCNHSAVQMMLDQQITKVNSITSSIYDFYNVKMPNTAITERDRFNLLIDCNDALLDKFAGDLESSRNNSSLAIDEITDKLVVKNIDNLPSQRVILTAKRIDKPQQSFPVQIDNSSNTPFIPILKEKPHSKKPISIMLCVDQGNRDYYNHPYEYELLHFTVPKTQFESQEPMLPMAMEDTPLMIITTVDDLNAAIEELSKCQEIAVDLEHHSFRTYLGLTCLLQISSRSKDYIIDTLQLRGCLDGLNEVFSNSNIIKVFHGASNDILWLQRDLGVYVVNMFDTYQAAILLEYPTKSLSYLLTKFCSITASKSYQRADWRVRPLPEDFILYARQDTHYLLYIFDKMRNELIEKDNNNLIYSVYDRSTSICLERYEKPYIDEDSHMELYSRSRVTFNSRQRYVLKKLFLWRDETARKVDECLEYILPAHMMLQISEHLPKEVQGILSCCNPVPYYVKSYQLVIHHIILEARKLPLEEVEHMLYYHKPEKPVHSFELKMDLISKFDFSHVEINPIGLSTILTESFEANDSYKFCQMEDSKLIKQKRKSDLFNDVFKLPKKRVKLDVCTFTTPFQRYQTMPNIQALLDESRKNSMPDIQSLINESRIQAGTTNSKSNEERVAGVLDFLSLINKTDINTTAQEEEMNEDNSTEDAETLLQSLESDKSPEVSRPIKQINKEKKWMEIHKEEVPENFEEIGDRTNKKLKKEHADIQPFDYTTANTSFLKVSNRRSKEKIHERYKAKRSQKLTGQKKSGLKSFSWGASS